MGRGNNEDTLPNPNLLNRRISNKKIKKDTFSTQKALQESREVIENIDLRDSEELRDNLLSEIEKTVAPEISLQKRGDDLLWVHSDPVLFETPLGGEGDRSHYKNPSGYLLKDNGYLERVWMTNGKYSRPPSLGPAISPVVKDVGNPIWEWWFHGHQIGHYDPANNVFQNTIGGRYKDNPEAFVDQNTPFPYDEDTQLGYALNAIKAAQNEEEEIVLATFLNRGAISPEEMIEIAKKYSGVILLPEEVDRAIQSLTERGIIEQEFDFDEEGKRFFLDSYVITGRSPKQKDQDARDAAMSRERPWDEVIEFS